MQIVNKIRFAEDTSINWNQDMEFNMSWLRCVEQYLKTRLKCSGYLYENEIFQTLGVVWDPRKQPEVFMYTKPYNDRMLLTYCLMPDFSILITIHKTKEES